MLLYFSPSMCSINSEQCFYLKYGLNANFSLSSPLKLEPQKVILKLATAHFLWCHQDLTQDFPVTQTKYQRGREGEKTASDK